jgi:hypothetical protein
MTHFGIGEPVAAHIEQLSDRLERWSQVVLAGDEDDFARVVGEELLANAPAELLAAYELAAPVSQLYAGLRRYWEGQGAPSAL